MDDGVDPVVPVVDAGERLEHLALVGEVELDERPAGEARVRHAVQTDHLVAVLLQVAHDMPAQLPAAPGHGDGGHASSEVSGRPLLRPTPAYHPDGAGSLPPHV